MRGSDEGSNDIGTISALKNCSEKLTRRTKCLNKIRVIQRNSNPEINRNCTPARKMTRKDIMKIKAPLFRTTRSSSLKRNLKIWIGFDRRHPPILNSSGEL